VSDLEKNLLRKCAPHYDQVELIPNCISLSSYSSVSKTARPNSLIFSGSLRYSANHDAMIWFLSEMFPLVQSEVPQVRLTITGDHAGLPLPSNQSVDRTGLVDDVRPLIASSWISVVPIRKGGGTRLKILEAMALRTPVVSTSKGAEGLGLRHNEHIMIADTPEDFAQEVIGLLVSPQLRDRLTSNAYQLVSKRFDWATVMPRFLNILERILRS
jgi:glycosyltransferase involved in cell wall biosynthesis